ncbi:MAG: protein kinase [Ruminococcus sp.]|uniref:protein kinase domain-containing protein n=1 Tax=Ruminococcus sp. TaxID=41978 RepID=UPI0025E15619|nr:protein kinase [Ruminococcus sp.]MCR5599323.1 protein kinase [Ruminococcus sp.]
MSTQIKGTKFHYEIDTKDFPHGFIAMGTESFVFMGRKISVDKNGKTDLSFSCVLKFKPKTEERLERFKEQELKIFEELQECRSVARIYDVIEDIGEDFELEIPGTGVFIRSRNPNKSQSIRACFCVVEEYIDGWSLEQYCRRKFWGLEKQKNNNWVSFHDFTDLEKEEVIKKYKNEKIFFRYQDKLLHFMQSLCGILMFISTTSKKKVLHLDIKPENIMVTRQSEELVLIDFGRSVFLPDEGTFVYHNMRKVDYKQPENINSLYSHGTIGFSAPECYALPAESDFPFSQVGYEIGRMSIESDIFSFGATFWECMNIVELVTKNKTFADDPRKFYEENLLNDKAYFNRDLSLECTGPLGGRYHRSLQDIIRKCTKQRTEDYLESDRFYHSYEDLKSDIEDARDSIPTVKKGENKQIRNAAIILGTCIGCIFSLLLFSFVYKAVGYRIATGDWEEIIEDIDSHTASNSAYQATQFDKLSKIVMERMQLSDDSQKKEVCQECFDYLCRDNDISALETTLIISMIKEIGDDSDKMVFIDKLIEYANPAEISSISSSVNSLGLKDGSSAYKLAVAIYSAENNTNYDYYEAYQLLLELENSITYRNSVKHLAISLNNKGDRVLNEIAEKSGLTRSEVAEFLNKVEEL